MPTGANFVFEAAVPNPENLNSAIEFYLQVGDYQDYKLRALLHMYDQITHEPAFDTLRTKEQLGYMVFSGVRRNATVTGFRVLVQSERAPRYLEHRIESFLRGTLVKSWFLVKILCILTTEQRTFSRK